MYLLAVFSAVIFSGVGMVLSAVCALVCAGGVALVSGRGVVVVSAGGAAIVYWLKLGVYYIVITLKAHNCMPPRKWVPNNHAIADLAIYNCLLPGTRDNLA